MRLLIRQSSVLWEAVATLVLLVLSQASFAACSSSTATITMNAMTYSGAADGKRPGTAFDGKWSEVAGSRRFFELASCSSKVASVSVMPAVPPIPGITYSDGTNTYPVYPTGVNGIGYVVSASENTGSWRVMSPPKTQLYSTTSDYWDWMGTLAKLMFVVTGRLQSGTYTIPAQKILDTNVYTLAGATVVSPGTISLASTTVTITASSCTMTTPVNQSVALPTVGRSALAAVGTTAGLSSGFTIGLNCDSGVVPYVTFTDASNAASTGDVLSLANGSTASGVGVRIIANGAASPVSYGPDSSAQGNTNQWKFCTSASGGCVLSFSTSYVRTGDSLKPGSVQAKATFTFSYQ